MDKFLKGLTRRVLKKWYIGVAILLLCLAVALVYGTLIADVEFKSQTTFSISEPKADNIASSYKVDIEKVIADYVSMATTAPVLQKMIDTGKIDKEIYSVRNLESCLGVERVQKANMIKVTATAANAKDVEIMLEVFNSVGIQELTTLQGEKVFIQILNEPSMAVQTKPNLAALCGFAIIVGLAICFFVLMLPYLGSFRILKVKDIEEGFDCVVLAVIEEEKV